MIWFLDQCFQWPPRLLAGPIQSLVFLHGSSEDVGWIYLWKQIRSGRLDMTPEQEWREMLLIS